MEILSINMTKSTTLPRIPTCQNCGRVGHYTNKCYVPSKITEGAVSEGLLALEVTSENLDTGFVAESHKRVRISDILNSDYDCPTRFIDQGINQENRNTPSELVADMEIIGSTINSTQDKPRNVVKSTVSKPKVRIVATTAHPLAKRILDQPLSVTIREYLDSKPQMGSVLIKSIQLLQKTKSQKKLAFSANEEASNSPQTLTYILAEIREQPVPIFVDNGATHSLIHRRLAERLGLPVYSILKLHI
ncbi:hypothetical protein BB561_001695 [Smittium simulii]|uniref:CCHC-type domain-containing protein n=1 Tax=Smittium simulii TaxID=133385 RepID=A0A2T9YTG0_9FUNG|nr:hypothetical protein BB561_001695 [Smittium simulii]